MFICGRKEEGRRVKEGRKGRRMEGARSLTQRMIGGFSVEKAEKSMLTWAIMHGTGPTECTAAGPAGERKKG